MLGLSPDKIQSLTILSESHPVVGEVLNILRLIHGDPSLRLYSALAHVIDKLCDELYEMKSTTIIGSSPKEDKIFERINVLITKLPDYQKASKSGKESLKEVGLVSESELAGNTDAAWAEQMANKHKKKR